MDGSHIGGIETTLSNGEVFRTVSENADPKYFYTMELEGYYKPWKIEM